jgi:hypothetical protein
MLLPPLNNIQMKGVTMKHRIFAYLVVTTATLLFIPSASATWSGFRSLGTTKVVGKPSCVQLGTDEVMCVAQSQQHTLMTNQFSKNAWSGWTNLSGTVTSDPSCIDDGTGNVFCGALSATNTLTGTLFNGKKWSSLTDSGGLIDSGPSCALLDAGRVLCGARSQTGALTTSVFNGTTWGKFSSQGSGLLNAPACTGDDHGNVICEANAMVNKATTTIADLFDGARWQGVLTLGGYFIDPPICMAVGKKGTVEGGVACFVLGGNDAVWVNQFNGNGWNTGDWTSWGQITGNVYPGAYSCALESSDNIVCGFINVQDSLFYEQTFTNGGWTGYNKVGGSPFIAGPSCASFATGKVMCVLIGLNNQALSVTGP